MRWPTFRRAEPVQAPDGAKPTEERWSSARFLLTLAILAWAVRSLVLAPFSIPSGSMLPRSDSDPLSTQRRG